MNEGYQNNLEMSAKVIPLLLSMFNSNVNIWIIEKSFYRFHSPYKHINIKLTVKLAFTAGRKHKYLPLGNSHTINCYSILSNHNKFAIIYSIIYFICQHYVKLKCTIDTANMIPSRLPSTPPSNYKCNQWMIHDSHLDSLMSVRF